LDLTRYALIKPWQDIVELFADIGDLNALHNPLEAD
jgi:hypothetical protein